MLIHREALELARLAPDSEEGGKYALSSLLIEADGHVVVCDGFQLVRVNGKVDEPSLFDSIVPAEEREHAEPLLLPAEAAQSFNAALKKRKKKKGEPIPHIAVSAEGDTISLASADGKVTRRFNVTPPELPFPDYARVMRKHVTVKRVIFSLEVLGTVLKALKGCGCPSITMDFAEGEGTAVRISGFSDPMGPVEGVVMPMRNDQKADEAA